MRVLVTLVVTLILSASGVWAPAPAAAAAVKETEMRVRSGSGADAVELDTSLFIPDNAESQPAPAIILAHGFGGGKGSVRGIASKLAENGYVTLTYTARGFQGSTGQISINAPDYEIADARTMIDLLADRSEVLQDSVGDPRVGIYGRSYGGALALLTAGYDERVDVISPGSTWNSLVSSMFPNDVGAPPAPTPAADPAPSENGVFKRAWAERFVEAGEGVLPAPGDPASSMECGNFRPQLCSALGESASDGALTPELQQLMEASSPASVLDRITAPTLLVQGEGDTLFPLSEADANARGIAANGTPVKMIWYSGGHGGQTASGENKLQLEELGGWFDYYLRDEGEQPATTFTYSLFEGAGTARNGTPPILESVDAYPGIGGEDGGVARTDIELTGDSQDLLSPSGGTPAALSALPPGLELDRENSRTEENPTDIPGQTALFDSAEFESDMQVLGAPVIDVKIASSTGDAVLFGKVYDVGPDGTASLLRGLVAPIRL
ncbi:MAG: alpha/beta fold hydrolase, partial [Actinomycetota bacterium]|nr:alpha/beta fold hydrolase [Actinomycetota bacterium]